MLFIKNLITEKFFWLQLLWFTIGLAGYQLGLCYELLFAIIGIWTTNIIYSLFFIKQKVVFVLFHFCFFLFLLGRPLILALQGTNIGSFHAIYYSANKESVLGFMLCCLISLFFIWLGACWADFEDFTIFSKNKTEYKNTILGFAKSQWKEKMFSFFLLFFIISALCKLVLNLEKSIFAVNYTYTATYGEFLTGFPYWVYAISTFFIFSFYFLLSLLPSKKATVFLSLVYLFVGLPLFLCGYRSGFVLDLLVIFIYVVFRNYYKNEKAWFGKKEIVFTVVAIPLLIIVLALIGNIRDKTNYEDNMRKGLNLVSSFVHKQGATFSYMCLAMKKSKELCSCGARLYSFGCIFDYVLHGKIAQIVFDAVPFPGDNSIEAATMSDCLAHRLSWLAFGRNSYLAGHGTGSSYIMEVYLDFGYLGLVVVNFIIGMFLIYALNFSKIHFLLLFTVLNIIPDIMFMPRAALMGGMLLFFRVPVWLELFCCFVLSYISLIKARKKGLIS